MGCPGYQARPKSPPWGESMNGYSSSRPSCNTELWERRERWGGWGGDGTERRSFGTPRANGESGRREAEHERRPKMRLTFKDSRTEIRLHPPRNRDPSPRIFSRSKMVYLRYERRYERGEPHFPKTGRRNITITIKS